jgi:hypothetical protein
MTQDLTLEGEVTLMFQIGASIIKFHYTLFKSN